jgi:hypothetical protein
VRNLINLRSFQIWTGEKVKIATVNRELAAMRKMIPYVFGKSWILKDIFYNSKVNVASTETGRLRILTPAEEKTPSGFVSGRKGY